MIDAIKRNDCNAVKSLVNVAESVEQFSQGNVKIIDDKFYWNGTELRTGLSERVLSMFKEGFDISHMVKFMSNLMKNPSERAIEQLYNFLDACSLPITPDGCFLAYKRINLDYTDCYSGKIDNSIGKIVEMDRVLVNSKAEDLCSTGLHFCSLSYLSSFSGARTVVVKINPKDVVSIPIDYGFSKGRCCKYEVISEIDGDVEEAFTSVVQENCNNVLGQEYDSKGKPLSMTPNAIRKRLARAKKAAEKLST